MVKFFLFLGREATVTSNWPLSETLPSYGHHGNFLFLHDKGVSHVHAYSVLLGFLMVLEIKSDKNTDLFLEGTPVMYIPAPKTQRRLLY